MEELSIGQYLLMMRPRLAPLFLQTTRGRRRHVRLQADPVVLREMRKIRLGMPGAATFASRRFEGQAVRASELLQLPASVGSIFDLSSDCTICAIVVYAFPSKETLP